MGGDFDRKIQYATNTTIPHRPLAQFSASFPFDAERICILAFLCSILALVGFLGALRKFWPPKYAIITDAALADLAFDHRVSGHSTTGVW